MKKLKIYLDTSVISHLQAEDVAEKMEFTLKLWEEIKSGLYDVFVSDLVLIELSRCDEPKKSIMFDYLEQIEFEKVKINDEIKSLANKYVSEGIIPSKYEDDAVHIASASVEGCNIIVSWNFKHMVRFKTIIGVNAINKLKGYSDIEIMTPESIVGEEEE